jgi:hypothetical protein
VVVRVMGNCFQFEGLCGDDATAGCSALDYSST